jgi:filamentous hemagglutinin family protein
VRAKQFRLKPVCASLLLVFAAHTAHANPIGAAVVAGQASFATKGNTLTVTNTPNTIINWQGFSIGANEITRFAQQSASSAVLNRVIANNPSNILGSLQSNGRVFLVNPSGIVFGANATVNVAGMVASTLNLSNADFLAGRHNFTHVPGAHNISNAGSLTAQTGGQIYLIAPNVENTGIINAPNGEILLAAGHSVELVNSNDPNLRVNITAPAGDATNVGQLVASSGSLGLFGAVVRNTGTVSANSATLQGGKIVFKASQRAEISGTVTANSTAPLASLPSPAGGGGAGGEGVGNGGTIQVLGKEVGIIDGATVTANGTQNGGTILIGGDYQGSNPNIQNAQVTYVAPTATISADGGLTPPFDKGGQGGFAGVGNGGKLIVWADDTTRAYGNLSAKGGANGGFIETSGHYLDVAGIRIDATALNGKSGSWLLDPWDVTITNTANASGTFVVGPPDAWTPNATGSTITAATIVAALNAGTAVTVTTTGAGAEAGNITVSTPITMTGATPTTLTLQAANNIVINQNISSTNATPTALNLVLDHGAAGGVTLSSALSLAGGNIDVQNSGVSGTGTLNVTTSTTTLTGSLLASALTLSGGVLNLNNAAATNLNTMTMSAGTLGGVSNVVLGAGSAFNWTGGIINGHLTTQNTTSVPSGNFTLGAGAIWDNSGTVAITSGGWGYIGTNAILNNSGSFNIGGNFGLNFNGTSGGQFNNLAAGTVVLSGTYSAPFTGGGVGGVFNNAGALNKTSTSTQSFHVINTGTINATTGTIGLTGAWSNTGGTLNVTTGILDLGGTFTAAALGTLSRTGGTVNLSGTLDLLNSATPFDISGAGQFGAGGLGTLSGTIKNGTITGTTLTSSGTLNNITIGSSMTESGALTITQDLLLGDGVNFNVGASTLYFNGAAANIGLAGAATSATLTHTGTLYAAWLNNSGVVTIANGVTVQGSGTLTQNYSGGWVNNGTILNNTANTLTINPATFTNNGALSATSGTTSVSATTFTNSGAVSAAAGTLNMSPTTLNNNGSISYAAGTSGTIAPTTLNNSALASIASSATTLSLTPTNFNNTRLTTANDTIALNAGALTLSGAVSTGNLAYANYTRAAGATINFGTGTHDLGGGTLDTGGTGVWGGALGTLSGILANGTLTGTALTSSSGTLNNITIGSSMTESGALTITQDLLLGDGVNFNVGASTLYFNGAAANIGLAGAATSATLTHTGTLYAAWLNNSGVVTIANGVTVQGSGTLTQNYSGGWVNNGTILNNTANTLTINPATFTNNGALSATSGTTSVSATTFTNSGAVSAAAGTMTVSSTNFTQTGTIDVAAGATFSRTAGFTNAGTGILTGNGWFNLSTGTLTNNGTITPGGAGIGLLRITGNLTQGATGVINLDINGLVPSTQHDKLQVSGAFTKGGTLNITNVGGYTPGANDSFNVMSFGSTSGTFATSGLAGYSTLSNANLLWLSLNGAATPSTVNAWLFNSSGDWSVASNWTNWAIPTASDSVVIDQPSGVNVTVSTGAQVAGSLTSSENLTVSGGSLTVSGATTITNNVNVSGGTLTLNGAATLSGITSFSGGTLALNGTTDLASLSMSGGTLSGSGAVSVLNGLIWTSGDMNRTGNVSLAGTSGWSAGWLRAGSLTNNGTLTISGTADNGMDGADAQLINSNTGTINYTKTGGNLFAYGGILTNQTGGVVDLQSDFTMQTWAGTGGVINNAGTFTKTAGTATTLSGVAFNHQAGSTFNVPTGRNVYLNSGGSFTGTSTGTGVGATLNGGNWTSAASAQLAGAWQWNAGSLTSGTLTNTGTLTIGGTGVSYINGATAELANSGTINHTKSGTYGLWFQNGGRLSNLSTGIVDLQSDVAMGGDYGGGSIGNAGTFTKTAGVTANINSGVTFNHQGGSQFDVTSGYGILLNGGGSFSGTSTGVAGSVGGTINGGNWTSAASAQLAGAWQWNAGSLTSGTLTNTGTLTIGGTGVSYINGATAELANSGTINHTKSGTYGLWFQNGGRLSNLSTGIVDLQSDVAMGGDYGGGSIGNAGTFTKTAGVTANINSGVTFNHQGGSQFDVTSGYGILLNGGGSFSGTSTGVAGSVGGTINGGNWTSAASAQLAGAWQWNAGSLTSGTLTNTGTLTIGGTGVSYINGATAELANSGTINHTKSGTYGLWFQNGGRLSNLSTGIVDLQSDVAMGGDYGGGSIGNAGTFTKTAGVTANINSGVTFNHQGGSQFDVTSGYGILLNGGGSFSGTSTGVAGSVGGTINGGNWTSAASAQLAGAWQWNAGSLTSGTLTNTGTLTIGGTGVSYINGATAELANSGTINHTKSGVYGLWFQNGGKLSNLSTGIVDLRSDVAMGGDWGGGSIGNAGTLTKTVGVSTAINSAITFANTGTVRVQTGNLIIPTFSTNSGTIEVAAGTTFTKSGGFTNTGTLTGAGNIVVGTAASKLVNQGIINPGGIGATGTLSITGDVQLSTGSNLNIELGGAGAGQFDVLAVSGAVTGIGATPSFGSVNASSINGFYATSSNTFTVLTAASGASSATFSALNYTDALLGVTYATGSATLNITGLLFTLWNTDSSGFWETAANWSNGLPSGTIRAVIDRSAANPVVSLSSAVIAATLDVGSGDTLSITAGSLTLNSGSSSFTGGAVLDMSGGTLNGAGSIAVSGPLNISGGTIASTGAFNTSGVTTVSGAPVVSGATWNNSGALSVMGSGSLTLNSGAVFNNLAAGNFTLNTGNAQAINATAGTSNFNNTGIFNKDGAVAASIHSSVAYGNTGTLNVNSGSLGVGGALTQSGTINVASGTTFSATAGFTNTGTLSGAGTITVGTGGAGLVNQGNINPGGTGTTGTLSLTGDLQFSTGSILNVEMSDATAGLFDALAVSAAVSGSTVVNVSALGNYLVPTATQYAVLTSAGNGNTSTFSAVNFADATFASAYAAGGTTLTSSTLFYTFWNTDAAGDWATAGNWSNGLPSATVRAIIDRAATNPIVTFNTVATTRKLTVGSGDTLNISGGSLTLNGASSFTGGAILDLSGGTLADAAGLTLNGGFNWGGGGTLTGAGVLTTSNTATTAITGTTFLTDKVWNNAGAINVNGGGVLQADGASVTAFTNQAGGVVNLNGTYSQPIVDWGGLNKKTFNNAGTLNKNTGSVATQAINLVFNNTGTVNVNEGTLTLGNNGADTGAYNIAAAATLNLSGGTRALNAGSALTNNGTLSISGANTTLAGGFAGTGALAVSSGTFNYTSASTPNLSSLAVSGGTLSGSGNITLTGSGLWTAGTLGGAGTLVVGNGATLALSTAGSKSLDRLLTNNGTVTFADAALTGAGSIQNNSLFQILNDFNISPAVANASGATLAKTAGAGSATISGAFNNGGTVNANMGTLAFSGGGTDTGAYNIATGATLGFSGGTRNLNSGTSVSVAGNLLTSAGTVNFNTGSDVTGAGNFGVSGSGATNINGGFGLASTGTVTLTSSGTTAFNVPLTFANTFTVSSTPYQPLGGTGNLVMNGAFIWNDGADIGGTGLLTTNGITTISSPSDLSVMQKPWINNGTVNFVSNGRFGYYAASGSLTLTNSSTGIINFQGTAGAPVSTWGGSGHQFINQGALNKQTGSTASQTFGDSGITFTNSSTGRIQVDSGTLVMGSPFAAGINSGSIVLASGATFSKTSGFTNTGTLSGYGTIAVGTGASKLVNQGNINPGGAGATGTLAISGDVLLDTGSNLNMELGGTGNGLFDKLAVTGAVSGNGSASFGNMNLSRVNGYTVATNDGFTLITAGSGINTATFAAPTLSGVTVTPSYAVGAFSVSMATGLTLTIAAEALTKIYGSADPTFTYVATGFAPGDTVGNILSGGLARVAGETVSGGSYAINQGSLLASAGYNISYTGASLTITAAPLTITADPQTKVYGNADPALAYAASGLVNGDTVAVITGALSRAAGQNVGSYAINQNTLANPNYNITFIGNNLSITQRSISIAVNAASKIYGNADNLTVTAGGMGFAYSDNISTLGTLARASGETVLGGPYAITQGTVASNTNYNLTGFTGNSLTITPATLNITANSTSKTYGDTVNFAGTEFTRSGLKFGETVGSVTLNSSGAVSTASVAGGPYSIVASNATGGTFDPGNYTINYANGTLTVNPAPVSLLSVAANNTSKTYGATLTFNGTEFTPVGLIGADTISGVTLSSAGAVNIANVGTYAITPSDAVFGVGSASNYTLSYVNGQLTVNPAPLTITVAPQSKVYGNADPALTYAVSGLLFSDALTGGLSRTAGQNVGTYAINQGSLSNPNYTATFNGNNLSITTRPISIATDPASKIYGNADPALAYTVGGSGLASWDTNATAFTGSIARAAGENVGAYAINQGSLVTANANYTITGFTGSDLSITSAGLVLNITANNASKTYGTTLTFSGTEFTPVGLAGGDTISGVTLASLGAVNTANVGTYAITPSNAVFSTGSASNYNISYVNGQLTITAAPLTITADVQTKVYGNADPALTYAANGFVNGDTAAAMAGGLSRADGKNVGSYAINQGTLANSNYAITYIGNNLNITARALTVGATGANKVYDGTTAATVTLADNRIANDVLAINNSTANFADKNVATGKIINVTGISVTGTDAGNYTFNTATTATADINARTLTVTAAGASKVYDGSTAAVVTLSDNRIANDVLAINNAAANFTDKNAATGKTINITGINVTGADAANYTYNTAASTTADITRAALTLSTGNVTKTYDGLLAAAGTATVTGGTLFGGDTLSGGTFAFTDKNAGSGNKTVTVGGITVNDGNGGGNYNVSYANNSASTITARALTVGATGANKVYDGSTVATVTLTDNRIGGDVLALGNAAANFTDKNVATGKTINVTGISVTGTDAGNYTFNTATAATADINAKAITVSGITADTKVYDGTASATLNLGVVSFGGIVSGDTVNIASGSISGSFADKNAGANKAVNLSGVTLSGGDAGNYTLNGVAGVTGVITARALTVGATGTNKVYDGSTAATATLTDNRINGDALTGTYTAANFTDKNVATGKTINITGINVTGTDAANYTFNTAASTAADITQAALTLSTGNVTKTYDGLLAAAGTATVTGGTLFGTDTLSGGNFAFTDKNAGSGNKTVTVNGVTVNDGNGGGNYNVSYANNSASTITARALTVGATGANKVYDGSTVATVTLTDNRIGGDVLALGNAAANFTDKNVATGKTINVTGISVTGTDAGNYTFNTATAATADINAKAITVSGITADTKVYDGTASATLNLGVVSFGGIISGDTVNIASGSISGSFADKNAGANKAVNLSGVTLSGGDAGNYTLNGVAGVTGVITARALTVGATGTNKVYDGSTATTVTLTDNRIANDVLSIGNSTADFTDKNAGIGKTVNVGGITLTGTDAANYTFNASTTTAADITARVLTVSATGVNKVYDGSTAATVTLGDNRVTNDVLTLGNAAANFANKNAGTGKTVNVGGITLTGADAANYTFNTVASTTANIAQAALTLSTGNVTKTYDGLLAAAGAATVTGGTLFGGDTLNGGNFAFTDKNAGSGNKTVTVNGVTVNDGNGGGNYNVSYANNTASTINKANATVTANSGTTTYSGVSQSVSGFTASGLVNNETAAVLTGVTASGSGTNAGSYSVVASGTDNNYNLTLNNGALTINKAALSVTANAATKTYDGLAYTGGNGVAYSGFVNNETDAVLGGTLGYGGTSQGATNAGNYTIAAGGLSSANYTLTYTDGALAVNQAALAVTAKAQSKQEGSADPLLTYMVAGLKLNDTEASTLSGALARLAGETVGIYPINRGTLVANNNYAMSYTPANFDIKAAPVTATVINAVVNSITVIPPTPPIVRPTPPPLTQASVVQPVVVNAPVDTPPAAPATTTATTSASANAPADTSPAEPGSGDKKDAKETVVVAEAAAPAATPIAAAPLPVCK